MPVNNRGGVFISVLWLAVVIAGFVLVNKYFKETNTGNEILSKWQNQAKKFEGEIINEIEKQIVYGIKRLGVNPGKYKIVNH